MSKHKHQHQEDPQAKSQAEADQVESEQTEQPAYKKLLAHEQVEHLEKLLNVSEAKAQENWDKLLRAMAELDNVKRRAERDVSAAHKYALDRFAEDLIPVLDSLEQAVLSTNHESHQAMKEGLELTLSMFTKVLEKFGIVVLNPLGETFDPNNHEAMMLQPSNDVKPNTVLTVIQKGYRLNDRIIRPARVIVAQAG